MIKPHIAFTVTRADEVAECWDGVGKDLYAKLWNTIVPLQRPIPNLEDSGPADHIGHENLASHWALLSPAEQVYLNGLAVKRDREYQEWLAKARED